MLFGTRQPVEGLPGPALGGFGPAGPHPSRGQVFPGLDKPLFEVTDLRLKPVLRRDGLGASG